MGAEVIVYTKNHRIDSLDTAIKYQGETEKKTVYIGMIVGYVHDLLFYLELKSAEDVSLRQEQW